MTTTEKQLEDARNELGHVLHSHQASYVNGLALRAQYAEREAKFLADLTQHPQPFVLNIPNSTSHVIGIIRSDYLSELASLKLALDLSESSPAFLEAFSIVQPLVDSVRRLEAQVQTEIEELSRKRLALSEAEAAARAKAEAALDKDPAIIAARKALALA